MNAPLVPHMTLRTFTFNGKTFNRGDKFDPKAMQCTVRKLNQLVDRRFVFLENATFENEGIRQAPLIDLPPDPIKINPPVVDENEPDGSFEDQEAVKETRSIRRRRT